MMNIHKQLKASFECSFKLTATSDVKTGIAATLDILHYLKKLNEKQEKNVQIPAT